MTGSVTGRVYGLVLRGRLPASFRPYLLPAPAGGAGEVLAVRWRRIDELPAIDEVWASAVPGGGRFALGRRPGGFDLAVSDQGRGHFRCQRAEIAIGWTAGGTGAAHYFFSYALPLWLELRGVPVLHGSAVSIGPRAVGFLGPSGVGKSTLAAELARLGWSPLADDGLVLRRDPEGGWRACHGPPLLRLWPSALDRLAIGADRLPRVHEALEKRRLSLDGAGVPPAAGLPLAALYLLERRPEAASPAAARPRLLALAPGEALARLIEHGVATAPATALGLAGRRLDLLADVVETVPVRRLRFTGGAGSATRVREAIAADLDRRPTGG